MVTSVNGETGDVVIEKNTFDLSDRIVKGVDADGNVVNGAVVEGFFYPEHPQYSNQASGQYSHAEGGMTTIASGTSAHAEGGGTLASGNYSHTEGVKTVAAGYTSHAEGLNTTANCASQHVFGQFNIIDPANAQVSQRGTYVEIVGNGTGRNSLSNARTLDWSGNEVLAGKLTVGAAPTNDMDVATKKYVDDNAGGSFDLSDRIAKGVDSNGDVVFGAVIECAVTDNDSPYARKNVASGACSHAEGTSTTASGRYSHAEGNEATASGEASHAEGYSTASGEASHAEGQISIASGDYSHAEGSASEASGYASHAEGRGDASKDFAHAEGKQTSAEGEASHAEGGYTTASGDYSHAEGGGTDEGGTTASGNYSHAEGNCTTASGESSHAEGNLSTASGLYSHAEGNGSSASGEASHAEGCGRTDENAMYAHAEGNSFAYGESAHSEGNGTEAYGNYSHTEGLGTIAQVRSQHVFGEYNMRDPEEQGGTESRGEYVEIVGNGTEKATSNARTLDWVGNEWIKGSYSANGSLTLGKGTADEVTITAAQLKQLLAMLS